MIWLYYSNNNAQTGFVSVYTKILINHIQILAITSIYIISLGPVQQTLYAPVKWITMDSTSVISFECFRGEDCKNILANFTCSNIRLIQRCGFILPVFPSVAFFNSRRVASISKKDQMLL